MIRILLLIFLPFSSLLVFSQGSSILRNYRVEVAGIKVGEIIASKTINLVGETQYTVKSNIKVNLLLYHAKLNYDVKSNFTNKGMISSNADVFSKKGHFYTRTTKTDQGFSINSKQEKQHFKKNLNGQILYSFSSLFFNEPIQSNLAYAEYYGDFIQIKKIRNGEYSGILDKNKDRYFYQNGDLIKVIKKNPVLDLVFIYESVI